MQALPDRATAAVDAATQPLLRCYLQHYQINFCDSGQASAYAIWQDRIMGVRIVEQRWQAPKPNGQTLVVVHGYFDHAGLYGNLIAWALQQGYAVHLFDLQGHGLSGGKPAAIDSFDEYAEVLHHILQRENYSRYRLLGQSTGCAVIANYLLRSSITTPPTQVIFLAPLVRSRCWAHLRYLYKVLRPLVYSVQRRFHASSHDRHFNYFLAHRDPLQATRIPLSWLGAMDAWCERLKQASPHAAIAPVIVQGSGDHTVDWRYNLPQLQRCFPCARVYMIAGAEHRLINERDDYWQQVVRRMSPC